MDSSPLFRAIVSQVEFYFSDSNIARDNLMRRMLEESGIKSNAILAFDRVKLLCWDIDELEAAAAQSYVLEVDTILHQIRRKDSTSDPDRTTETYGLYVDRLPWHARTIDGVKDIFSQCGVDSSHISVPHFHAYLERGKDLVKGYAFIDISTRKEAEKALKELDGYLPEGREEGLEEAVSHVPMRIMDIKQFSALRDEYRGLQRQITDVSTSIGDKTRVLEMESFVGCVVRFAFKGKTTTKLNARKLRALFESICPVEYLDYTPPSAQGWVRFPTARYTTIFVNHVATSPLSISDNKISFELLDVDGSRSYWEHAERHRLSNAPLDHRASVKHSCHVDTPARKRAKKNNR